MESNDHSCIGEGDRHYLARTDGETERQNIEQSDIETYRQTTAVQLNLALMNKNTD